VATASISVNLSYITAGSGNGGINLTFDCSAAPSTVTSTSLQLVDPSGKVSNPVMTQSGSNWTYAMSTAPVGSYQVLFLASTGSLTARHVEAMEVFQGVTTAATVHLLAADFAQPYVAVSSLSLNKTTSSLNIGSTETLVPSFNTGASNTLLSWSSSNSAVASVTQTGIVTALSAGTSTIVATSADNSQISASCVETVNSTGAGITVYVNFNNYSYIYFWSAVPAGTPANATWPGVPMTKDPATGWYTYTFPKTSSINLIFDAGSSGGQTGNLSQTTGTWWYNGTWSATNPNLPVVTALPAGGKYTTAQTVTMTSSNSTDKIYYTTNGTTPSASSSLYTSPLTLSSTCTLNAIGINAQGQSGSVSTYNFTIDPNLDLTPPTITASVAPGTYSQGQLVTFTMTDNRSGTSTAYYTTDGSTPTTSSAVYTQGNAVSGISGAALNVSQSCAVQFLLVDASGNQSAASFIYRIGTSGTTDFRKESIYFLITTRFFDGDPSNNLHCWDDAKAQNPDSDPAWRGDFKGLIEKLDYIKALGFSAIWITPVVENGSSYDYHGYHALNFFKVDPRLESGDTTYQDLINAVHAKGMKLIQDIVLNHSSNMGEENLFPLFTKNWSQIYDSNHASISLNADTPQGLVNIAPPGMLPSNYATDTPTNQYNDRENAMKNDSSDTHHIYHHEKSLQWEGYTVETGQIAGDCVDLDTENPVVATYLRQAYYKMIDEGVDAFRMDTMKHISRLTLDKEFFPKFLQRAAQDGNSNFFMFGEVAALYENVVNSGIPAISPFFYTWNTGDNSFAWGTDPVLNWTQLIQTQPVDWSQIWNSSVDASRQTNEASTLAFWNANDTTANLPNSNNAFLNGVTYHTPDYSQSNGFHVIDFPMHWAFINANNAFNMALSGDNLYNDATWNVVYVASHDYSPDQSPSNERFSQSQATWAENMDLMFTFRGIPALYCGDEIEFQKGDPIDVGPNAPLSTTGRAYFGDHLTGTVTATGFGKYTNATGAIATTLQYPLAVHVRELNLIRRAIPALQMGEYQTGSSYVSGNHLAYIRRYTDATTDSLALVTISGDATFSGIPNGTYTDAVTGDTKTVTNSTLSTSGCTGQGNLRVYVLSTALTPAPGKVVDASDVYFH
jgi:glycosidase